MSFQILDSISARGRPILGFGEEQCSCGLGPGIVHIDVVNTDENTMDDPWESGP
jgi:hypothetical protein